MLLVARWLEEGAGEDGEVSVSVAGVADELGLEADRAGMLAVMAGLGELEDRRQVIDVSWPPAPAAAEARVTLASDLRRDARRLFGAEPQPGGARQGRRTPSSRSCARRPPPGAPVSGSAPVAVFGKAITSRIDRSPASSITMRSRPRAMPAVRRRAQAQGPQQEAELAPPPPRRRARSARRPAPATSRSWMRMLPPPISRPFSTTS